MSINGGGNLYPNWLGSATLSIPNNQVVVNGALVNVVPVSSTANQGIASITRNTKTLVYTIPDILPAGTYLVGGETQSGSSTTAWGTADVVDWVMQGIGDPAADYAEVTLKPYYNAVVLAANGNTPGTGLIKFDLAGITQLTTSGQLGIYVTYFTTGSGTATIPFNIVNWFYQKIA